MVGALRRLARRLVPVDPLAEFHSDHYLRHNARTLEHLATLNLPLAGRSVLEVGAGIGDHTSFFLDRDCRIVTSDARARNLELLRQRWPGIDARLVDLDQPPALIPSEVVYCYGTLYHLSRPAEALRYLADCCTGLLLIQTVVSWGDDERLEIIDEPQYNPSQAAGGVGCRPTRLWVHRQLTQHFPHVYLPATQPWHLEFPIDWTNPQPPNTFARAIFIATRVPLVNPLLTTTLPERQRHA
jgi:hypothetical protein